MKKIQPVKKLLLRLWPHIRPPRRLQFGLLLVLMVMASFAEIISIGAVIPFLAVLTDPGLVFGHIYAQPFIQLLKLTSADQLLFPLTVAFGVSAVLAGIMRLLLLWTSTRLSYATGAELSISIYRRTLYQPYAIHIARNSSEIINGISNKTNGVIRTILMFLNLIGSFIMLVTILIALLAVNPFVALGACGSFGLLYMIIMRLTRHRLLNNSQRIAHESTQVIKSLQEGLGGIRDVLINGSQDTYCKIYRSADLPLRHAQASSGFISSSPRYGMETLGMIVISMLAYMLVKEEDGIGQAVPILGAFALGAQRLLPVLQQAYSAWSTIKSSQAILQDAMELLEQPLPVYADNPTVKKIIFEDSIKIDNLSFRYSPENPWVLNNIELTIKKGSCVGFIGQTGSGKSTLLDIIMGLLRQSEGMIEIDDQPLTVTNNRAWQAHIAHVPQHVFLADSSIAENIAFGVSKELVDMERVKEAAKRAQISEFIENQTDGYEAFVGERGVRMSGGQCQRIGIARALYNEATILIFDEATSALDSDTEKKVMETIESLSSGLTVLIIAHRLNTLRNCNKIVQLDKGKIVMENSYEFFMGKELASQEMVITPLDETAQG